MRTAPVDELRAGDRPVVRGAFHVHTRRSDGTGTVDDVARAAARAGLRFVILADHGDATRTPEPPAYRAGVLCIDGVEISTSGGHYIAIDLPVAPYPLRGEPRAVVEDVSRLGGFGVVAHPDSPKQDLAWRDWSLPVQGIEWLNADSEWRDESSATIARAFATYFFRPAPTLAALLDRPDPTLARWDRLGRERALVGLAGSDAHARIAGEVDEDTGKLPLLRVPGYEVSFRLFGIRVELETPPSGDAAQDSAALIRALRAGRVYTAIDAFATPGVLQFVARAGAETARMGGALAAEAASLEARLSGGPSAARLALLRDGALVTEVAGNYLGYEAPQAGVYRLEARLPGALGTPPVPWIVANPIYLGRRPRPEPPAPPPAVRSDVVFDEGEATGWSVERAPGCQADVASTRAAAGQELAFRYALAGGEPMIQFAALVLPIGNGLTQYDRLMFTARSDRPMRLSVQLRVPRGEGEGRWQRSVYVDPAGTEAVVNFTDMPLVDSADGRPPNLARVHAILFVVDTTNTRPGTSGVVWLDKIRLEATR